MGKFYISLPLFAFTLERLKIGDKEEKKDLEKRERGRNGPENTVCV